MLPDDDAPSGPSRSFVGTAGLWTSGIVISGLATDIDGAAFSEVNVGTEGKYPPPSEFWRGFDESSIGEMSGSALTAAEWSVVDGGGAKGVDCGTEADREGCMLSGALSTVGGL